MQAASCPCESGKPYSACCQPCHQGSPATNAEALMRARYSAYVFGLEQYLLATWHSSTRPANLNLSEDVATKWLGLSIQQVKNTSATTATVAFIARYKIGGQKAERLQETSQFLYTDRWCYVSGEIE